MPTPKPSWPDSGGIWHRHASEIRKLYRNNTVENVKLFMEKQRDFPEMAVPTWNEKLGQLGMRKNVTQDEWRIIYQHCRSRLEDPTRTRGDLKLKRTKRRTEIIVRNRPYTWDKAWKNMKSAQAIGQLPHPQRPLSPLPPDIVIRTPIATALSLPSSRSPIRSLSPEDSWAQSTTTINTPETGLILPGDDPTDQDSNGCLSSDTDTHDLFDHLGTRMTVSTAERVELVWRLCITGLPIEQVVNYAVGVFGIFLLSSRPSLRIIVQEYPSLAFLHPHRSWLCSVFSIALPHPEPVTDIAFSLGIEKCGAPSKTSLKDLLPHLSPTFAYVSLPFECDPQQSFTPQFLSALLNCALNDPSAFTSQKYYLLLFLVIYQISNNIRLSSDHYRLFENLDAVFKAVPGKYLETLLCTRLASVRAAFEASLELAGEYRQPDAFHFLVKVGATYGWLAISAKGHLYLSYAASMNLVSALQMLLDHGCRPDFPLPARHLNTITQTAIVKALSHGNLQCAQRLLQSCDVNKQIRFAHPTTNFEQFLRELDDIGELSESGLKLFLQAGANLDKPIRGHMDRSVASWPRSLSGVDYLFYFHRSLFNILPPESAAVQHTHLSSAGILLSLEAGVQSFETYLGGLVLQFGQQSVVEFLPLLIAEQFLICDLHHRKRDTDLGTVRALVSFGTRFGAGISAVLRRVPDILHSFVKLVGDDCDRSHIEAALYLVENGATVTGTVLSWMTRLPDTRLFDLALRGIKDSQVLENAVICAAARNNFEGVTGLLHAGAELDTDCGRCGSDRRVSIIASVLSSYEQKSLTEMLDLLLMKGAPLRLSKTKPHLHHLLQFTLESLGKAPDSAACMERVRYIVGAGYDLQNSPFPTASLLESCCNMQVFEYLYERGAQLRPGSPLAVWINMGGRIGLCREMLKAGASPNSYARYNRPWMLRTPLQVAAWNCRVDVVELLLEAGSDVNAPAKGWNGFTALQASCRFRIDSLEDQQRKLRIVCTLLSRGADVNAAPARVGGRTALQEAAVLGDLTVAKLLLFHNPMADVNAPPCEVWVSDAEDQDCGYQDPNPGTALDLAAGRGRLDMVKLLLNCNGLSHRRGKTGYDGSIQVARNAGYLAVADLIRQHAEDAKRSGTSPDLSRPPRHWCEYGYESGPAQASEWPQDEETSLSADDSELSEDDWESSTVGCISSGTHPSDPISAAYDHKTQSLTTALGQDDPAKVTAN